MARTVPYHKTKAFKTLQAEWRHNLQQSGFVDIEYRKGQLRSISTATGDGRFLAKPDTEQRAGYFKLASRWLYANVWRSRHERTLWELHTEGVGVRTATERLRPRVNNTKFVNENILRATRECMKQWLSAEALATEEEVRQPESLWEEAMLAEGFDPEGYTPAGTRSIL